MRGTPADPLQARQRLERALTAVDWMPPQLPPRAVLVVRRLVVGAPSRRGFGTDVTNALRQRAEAARRPWLHADAASADAVIFADEAELVACLIRDWLRGAIADRWWWRDVLGGATAEEWLRRHALPRGDLFVPAMSLLEPRREAVAAIARLAEADARVAMQAVARAFALTALESSEASPDVEVPSATGRDDTARTTRSDRDILTRRADALRRWIATAPEILDSRLGRTQRRLAAVVMATLRAPSWTRVSEFAVAVAALDRIDVLADPAPTSSHVVPRTVTRGRRTHVSGTADATRSDPGETPQKAAPVIDGSRPPEPAPEAPRQQTRRANTQRRSAVEPSERGGAIRRRPRSRTSLDTPGARSSEERIVDAPPAVERWDDRAARGLPRPPATQTDAVVTPAVAGVWSETDFGGIFYLLNAWIAMGLYGDFTAPRAGN